MQTNPICTTTKGDRENSKQGNQKNKNLNPEVKKTNDCLLSMSRLMTTRIDSIQVMIPMIMIIVVMQLRPVGMALGYLTDGSLNLIAKLFGMSF